MKKLFYFIWLPVFLVSCAATHNVPLSSYPNKIGKNNIVYSFVDQNGNFYPDNWRKAYGNPPPNAKKNEYSLMKIAAEKGIENQLQTFENSLLSKLQQHLKSKKRIFIFVHGFNSDYETSTENYEYARSLLNIDFRKDDVIQFYWDGLKSESLFGGAKIWFNATTFSQMAGEFGLRRLLNILKNKQIYILSHSRGASVVLSALSSPPFEKSIKEETLIDHHVNVDDAKNLLENNNKIVCIMLAPAVGLEDFKAKDFHEGDDAFRQFTPQLQTIHITINNTDNLLKKYIGVLSKHLEPTDLGFKEDAYNALCEHYIFFEKTDFTGMKTHAFKGYLHNPKFKEILKQYHLLK